MKKLFFSLTLALTAASLRMHATLPDFILQPKGDSIAAAASSDSLSARYVKIMEKRVRFFNKLIPTHAGMQYAGDAGVFSFGPGWDYSRHRWMTELSIGFLPSYSAESSNVLLMLRQVYDPFHIRLGGNFELHPLQTGMFFTYIFGGEFWDHQPRRYPKHYYKFSSGFRANILLGSQLTYIIPPQKRIFSRSVSAYYQLSTSDLYIVSAVPNKKISFWDILVLGFGVRFDFW